MAKPKKSGKRKANQKRKVQPSGEQVTSKVLLSKHLDESFESQTICVSGHGFVNCKFSNCTLVVTNTPYQLSGCQFTACNWRLEYNLLWGDPRTRDEMRHLLDLVDGVGIKQPQREIVAA